MSYFTIGSSHNYVPKKINFPMLRWGLCISYVISAGDFNFSVVIILGANDLNLSLDQAWDLYYHVFRRIDKQLQSLTTLDLEVWRSSPPFSLTYCILILCALTFVYLC